MKILFQLERQKSKALTFIEGLVVAIVLFGLAALLFPLVDLGRRQPPIILKAKVEIADIENAIRAYQMEYGRYPVPTNIEAAVLARKEDLTFGGPMLNAVLKTGTATPVNADVMAILMDTTKFPDGTPAINDGHSLNPKQIKFINVKFSGDNKSPGVGNDMVFRDPWGNPYVISMDLSGDGNCRDAFYRNHLVSGVQGPSGLKGLVNYSDTNGISDVFEFHGKVMVWSLGPDGKADATKPANVTPNRDNILSWE